MTDGPTTLDECTSAYLAALADERGAQFAAGDAVLAALLESM